jgi:hypothetical protein
MKYSLFSFALVLSLFLTCNIAKAQTVFFAKDVKPSGEMIGQNTKFYFPKGESDLKMLVKLSHKVNTDTAIYKVYRVAKGERYLDQTIKSPIKPEWFWFPEDVLIRGQGKYLVEVYARGSDAIIATGNFTLEWVK